MRDPGPWGGGSRAREPALNLPWPVTLLVAALVAAQLLRLALRIPQEWFAFTSVDLDHHRFAPLITYQFVHGGWAHLGVNSLFTVAFGAPVARWLGVDARGAAAFLLFFLACGVLAALGYAVVSPARPFGLVGASGAASGLMGAAARLLAGRGRLGPIFARRVITMGLAWVGINVVLGLSGLTPGSGGMPVAWQAHVVGFVAGVLLAGVAGAIAGVSGRLDTAD